MGIERITHRLIRTLFIIILIIILVLSSFANQIQVKNVAFALNTGNPGGNNETSTILNNKNNPSSNKSVLWSFAAGLRGMITTSILSVDLDNDDIEDSILIGTTKGVNIIDLTTGNLVNNYPTKSSITSVALLNDANGDGNNDIVFSTLATREDNIVVIDSKNCIKLWGYKPTTKVFTENLGWANFGTKTWSVDSINDSGESYVIASSWRYVFKFDGNTGKLIWKFKATDDVWTVKAVNDLTGDGNADILIGSQEGYIYLIDGIKGQQRWGKKLTKSYHRKLQMGPAAIDYAIDRSVWSIELIEDLNSDGIQDIITAAEDGYIYALAGNNGEILWKYKCLLLSKPRDETGFGSQNFFNVRAQVVGDIDRDGTDDVVALARSSAGKLNLHVISAEYSKSISRSKDYTRAKNDKTEDQFESEEENYQNRQILNLEHFSDGGIGGMTRLVTVKDVSGDRKDDILILNENAIVAIDSTTGNVSKEYIVNEIFGTEFQDYSLQWVDDITGDDADELLLTLRPYGIIILDLSEKSLLWDYLNTGNLELKIFDDVTGDGIDELLIEEPFQSEKEEFKPPWETTRLIRGLYLFDKLTGDIIWNYTVPLNKISSEGITNYKLISDVTGDQIKDVIWYSQDKKDLNSSITLLDGNRGRIVWSKPPSAQVFKDPSLSPNEGLYEKNNLINRRIKTLSMVEDPSGDGGQDILVGGEDTRIYLLDGKSGKQIWEVKNTWDDQDDSGYEVWFDSELDMGKYFDEQDYSYNWESDLDGFLSTDPQFNSKLSVGEHIITLRVEDGKGNWGMDSVSITAEPSKLPVFRLKDNQHLKYFADEQCNAWIEPRNFDGSKATIVWESDIDGVLNHGQNLNKYLSPGIHTITVNVIDNEGGGAESEDTMVVSVLDPRDCRVNFGIEGYDWYFVPAYKEITFRSELDYEGSWENLEYNWFVDDTPAGSIDTLHHSFTEGIHEITLEIYDSTLDLTASRTKYVVVNNDAAPQIHFSLTDSNNDWTLDNSNDEFYYTIPCFPSNSAIWFDVWVDGEYDENDIEYTIDLGDGSMFHDRLLEYNFTTPGNYDIIATAQDNDGKSASASITIKVVGVGVPVPRWSYDFEPGCWVGEQRSFDASSTYDLDGILSGYTWDFGDGTSGTGESTSHTYEISGKYIVKLTIKDDTQNSITESRIVSVYSIGTPMVDMNVWINNEHDWVDDPSVPYKLYSGDSVTLEPMLRNTVGGWDYKYNWYLDGTHQESAVSFYPILSEGKHEIRLEVKDPLGNIESIKYDFIVRSNGGLRVSINEPSDGDKCAGSELGGGKKVKNIDWLPWTCSVYLLNDNNILIAGNGRLTSTTFDATGISPDMNWRYPPDDSESWIDDNQVQILDDQDGDDVLDISCWLGMYDDGQYVIISGRTGQQLSSKQNFPNPNMGQGDSQYVHSDYFSKDEIFVEDFNKDGVSDAIVYRVAHETNKLALSVVDGNNGGMIWEKPELFKDLDDLWAYQYYTPATIIDDQNGDGIRDILVGTSRTDSTGADLRLFNGRTGSELDTIVYETQELDEDWVKTIPVVKVAQIDDMTGDGERDIVLIREAGTAKENYDREETVLEVIDLAEGKCLRSFETDYAEIINNGDINNDDLADVILIIDGVAYCLNGGFGVKILSPTSSKLSADTFTLKWDKPKLESEIEVDGISYGYFQNGETKLTLSSGKHIIKVMVQDEFGGIVSDTIKVEIPTATWPLFLNSVAVVLFFCYVTARTAVPYIQRKKRKNQALEEINKIKARKLARTRASAHIQTQVQGQVTAQPGDSGRVTTLSSSALQAKSQAVIPYVASKMPKEVIALKALPITPMATPVSSSVLSSEGIESLAEEKPVKVEHGLEERLELYRTALETALSDKEITEDEETLLSWLREK